jgi:tripartite-type tricarboxylate transporter receptor subunit TctC
MDCGLFPAKTPTPIVTAMQELLNETLKAPNVTETMARASFEPLNYSGEQLDALQRATPPRSASS